MSADELKRAIEEAEKAAKGLKDELRRAKALVHEARHRLGRQFMAEQMSFSASDPVTDDGPSEA